MIGNIPGLGPANLEGGPPSGSRVAFPLENISTPLLDITQPLSAMELIPARFGHIPYGASGMWSIESVVGVQTVPAQIQAGSDPAHSNVFVSTPSPPTADVNGATTPPSITNGIFQVTKVQILPNLPVFLDITAGAQGTGGFKCMARLIIQVAWVAVGG